MADDDANPYMALPLAGAMRIYVRIQDESPVMLDVEGGDSVAELKQKFAAICGIPVEQVYLSHCGFALDPDCCLALNDVEHGDYLASAPNLHYNIEFFIETPQGQRAKFGMASTDTVHDLKLKIKSKWGYNPSKFNLYYRGNYLYFQIPICRCLLQPDCVVYLLDGGEK